MKEFPESRISLVTLAPELFHGTVPFTAISKYVRGELFLIAIPSDGGWLYRLDYPYYSWAETVVRPEIPRRELSEALVTLNAKETNRGGQWKRDNREMTSAVKFLDEHGLLAASRLEPHVVVDALASSKAQIVQT